jgi:hypothetical protein
MDWNLSRMKVDEETPRGNPSVAMQWIAPVETEREPREMIWPACEPTVLVS